MSLLVGATSACAGAAGQGGGADLGAPIGQSLRFQSANATSLDKTLGTPTDRDRWSWSCWAKRSTISESTRIVLFAAGPTSGLNDNNRLDIGFEGSGNGFFFTSQTQTEETTAKYRDLSAWIHVAATWDGTTLKGYINGVRQIANTTISGDLGINGPFSHRIGRSAAANEWYFNGYIAEMNFLDGTLVGETTVDGEILIDEFGNYNTDGVWVPKAINFTSDQYGNNGFRLKFDSTADGGIGDDSAPTGGNHDGANDFTANNFDTSAISSSNEDNDIDYNDTPTNNYATLNKLLSRSASLNFEHANLRAQFGGGGSHCGMAGFGMVGSSGKYYWEVTLKEQKEGSLGIVSEDFDLENGNNTFGTDTANGGQGWEWILSEGTRYNNNVETGNSHTVPNVGDTIGFLLDTTAGTCTIEINGVAQTANNGAQFTNIPTDKSIYPYFRLGGASGDANLDWNFGQMPFQHEPSGYQHVATNSLTEPTIKNGKEHFEAKLYSGTNSSNAITGLEFSPDFIWIKVRDAADNHVLVDTIRGTDSVLFSNSLDAEASSFSRFTSFDSNGFTVDGSDAAWNNSSNDYVAWCWKAGGTAVSNTDGTITSSVSANTDAGFSIISYTGNGTAGATIGHGLTEAPEFVIVKRRAVGNSQWYVYHGSIGNQSGLNLNGTGAQLANSSGYWNNTSPTNQVISLGNFNDVNGNTNTLIGYAWHSVEGYSKIGKYGGGSNAGSAPDLDGAYIETGFRPAWLLVKRINAAGDPWILLDSSRDTTNFAFRGLQPNTTAQEPTSGDSYACDFLANGFKWRTANAGVNNASATYVYLCFAENPFGGENAPPATAR